MSDQPPPRIEYKGQRYVSSSWLCSYLIQYADKLKEMNQPASSAAMENLCAGLLLEDLQWEP